MIHKKIQEKKYEYFKEESKVLSDNQRLNVLKQIVNQSPMLYKLDSKIISVTKGWKSTKEQILNGSWKWTGCGKTTFLEKLWINNFFWNLVKTEWISGIDIGEKREARIQSCFSNETEIHIAKGPDELDALIETLKLRTHDVVDENDDVNSLFGENKKMDRVIVMANVSGVADISRKFATFLTVSRKFGYHCVYVFYVIATSQIWQKIISQSNIFDIFPSSVLQNSDVKILQCNCIIQSKKYVPICSLWLNRVFTV